MYTSPLQNLFDRLRAGIADLRYNWKPKLKRFRLHLFAFGVFALGLLEAVDPYALQSILPDRWQSLVYVGIGAVIWLLRKATAHPPVVTTTFYGEHSPTEPAPAPEPNPTDLHRLDDDGGPHAPAGD